MVTTFFQQFSVLLKYLLSSTALLNLFNKRYLCYILGTINTLKCIPDSNLVHSFWKKYFWKKLLSTGTSTRFWLFHPVNHSIFLRQTINKYILHSLNSTQKKMAMAKRNFLSINIDKSCFFFIHNNVNWYNRFQHIV